MLPVLLVDGEGQVVAQPLELAVVCAVEHKGVMVKNPMEAVMVPMLMPLTVTVPMLMAPTAMVQMLMAQTVMVQMDMGRVDMVPNQAMKEATALIVQVVLTRQVVEVQEELLSEARFSVEAEEIPATSRIRCSFSTRRDEI